ncbi:universal stress protein [Salipaludibacillus sp. CF4.18]|uniref:universal stress protein n=1 Tax=Salipaludibacillus sp. CF4.18 TaxID=3373081 RepID=UPI003EE74877
MFKKILLATDGSEHAFRAAEKAIEVAKCNPEATIHIVYVVESSKSDVLKNWNTTGSQGKRDEKVSPTEKLIKAEAIHYEVEYLHGEPGPTIVKHANENQFDVVIIGSRGLNGIQGLVLGSVSHKVAKRAHCAVLLIK